MTDMTKRVHKAHTATARKLFGESAVAYSSTTAKYTTGKLAGKCTTCLRSDCTARRSMTIGVLSSLAVHVRGQGHSWAEAMTQARSIHGGR